MKISIVTPTYNEIENIEDIYNEIKNIFKDIGCNYEHLIIDNSSTDGTVEKIKSIAEQDKNVKVIINSKNFGHIRSPFYGLLQTTGDATILMASDFQDPPELIRQYVKLWKEGNKIVLAQKSKSKENKWLSTFNRGEPFEYNNYTFPTVEHAFHSQKLDENNEKREQYIEKFTDPEIEPNEIKKMGGRKYFEENDYKLRGDWNSIRLKIMEDITMNYYAANPEFLEKLIKTGDKQLIHTGFRIDDFWGVKKGEGENHHGKILMKVREELQ